jgi:hypothetical protein
VVATTRLADTPVTCTFVPPRDAGAVPFHLSAVTARGVVAQELDLGRDYLLPVVTGFLAACDGRVPDREDDDLLAPVHLVQELRAALAVG